MFHDAGQPVEYKCQVLVGMQRRPQITHVVDQALNHNVDVTRMV